MAFLTIIEDDTGTRVASVRSAHDAYLLPDGSEMFVGVEPAWCNRCKKFRPVESLTSPEELEQTSRSFYEHRIKNPLFPDDMFSVEKQLTMSRELLESGLHRAAQWRLALEQRSSSAKCLGCGFSDFVKLPKDHSWVVHPGQPERRVRVRDDIIHASMAACGNLFDTEGNRIPGRYATR